MYQPVPPYTDPVPPSTNLYRTWTAPGQLKTGNVAWGLQTSAPRVLFYIIIMVAHSSPLDLERKNLTICFLDTAIIVEHISTVLK